MYEALRPIEERIIALNLERINDTSKIDALLERGLITQITADFYRAKIIEQANAFRQAQRYKNMFWYIGLPLIGLAGLNAYFMTGEEELHEHPEYVAYPHLRLRLKKFPWGDGDKTLFHNPEVNH
ncbi:Cytochrome c oxidase subunit 6A1 [Mitosporidium daphniae]